MRDIRSVGSLQAALQFMMSSDMPSDHKAVVIDLLTSALREQDARRSEAFAANREYAAWQEDELLQLQTFLNGKVANSWQHADELLMHLSNLLDRNPNDVRSKATELGFGEGVDYRLAKLRTRTREER